MTAFLFPGQGSQKVGMGEGLFDEFTELTAQADDILGYSIKTLCLEDPQAILNDTQFTQPALYVVNALSHQKRLHSGPAATVLAGHSLGEYNALLAAQVFDFATGLKLVQKRGQLMSQAQGGGMAAIIGLTVPQLQEVLANHQLHTVEIANYNSPLQTVITGPKAAIEASLDHFKAAGARLVMPLKVSGAFHSSLMAGAQAEFKTFLTQFTFNAPQLTVIANVTARPYPPQDMAELLATQITSSVQWTRTIEWMLEHGQTEFEEIGPGKVLAGLVAAIQKSKISA